MGFLSSRLLSRHFGTTVVFGLALHLLAFVSGALPAWAQTGPPPSEPQRPALQIGNAARFDEDWSVLKGVDLSKTDDFWDRVKFIPLTADGSVWLSIGGQVRERREHFRHFLFGSAASEDTDAYVASRHRPRADRDRRLEHQPLLGPTRRGRQVQARQVHVGHQALRYL